MPEVRIGTSGWSYKDWRGRFYPADLPSAKWLEHYAQHFDTVEVNSTFYHLPREATVANWRRRTPEGFLFAVKASRFITHKQRLQEPATSLERFLDRMRHFGEKCGPLLFQLPPNFPADGERLASFLAAWEAGWLITFEFRHPSWFCEEVYDLLRAHNAALCIADTPSYPQAFVRTANFVYLRLHGAEKLYVSRYTEAQLEEWAGRIRGWLAEGADVYVYFDNDYQAHAVVNAQELRERLTGEGRPCASRRA
ncbi:MAG TPA: DUF72 domain-containing protein [Armatimonadetes bacterium]|nr:DUF72 domain-containing protein [Armatimonadota bacterium]